MDVLKINRLLSNVPANIRLDEDILKTSWRCLEDVFRLRFQKTSSRRLQDVLIKKNMFALAFRLQKTSSRRLQDVLVKTNVFVLAICLQDVFKTSLRHLQDIFKTFWRRLQDAFKTFSRLLAKISSRRFQGIPSK